MTRIGTFGHCHPFSLDAPNSTNHKIAARTLKSQRDPHCHGANMVIPGNGLKSSRPYLHLEQLFFEEFRRCLLKVIQVLALEDLWGLLLKAYVRCERQ